MDIPAEKLSGHLGDGMHYYRRMLYTFCSIAIVYTVVLAGVFLTVNTGMQRDQFQRDARSSLQQLGEYADARFQAVFGIHAMLRASEYTTKYLQEDAASPDRYARLKMASFVRSLYGIAPAQMQCLAVSKLSDDYAILQDSTGDVAFLQNALHLTAADMQELQQSPSNGRGRQLRFFRVQDDAGRPMVVIAKWEWLGRPSPLFTFTAFYDSQLIPADALQGGTFVLLYDGEMVASAGALDGQRAAEVLRTQDHAGLASFEGLSSVSGVSYVYLLPRTTALTPAFWLILLAGLLACAGGIAMMYLITRRMYTPIAGVLTTAGGAVCSGDEFTHINQTLLALHSDVETMSRSLEHNHATLRTKCLRELLLGILTGEQAQEGLQQFHLPKESGPLSAILVRYQETSDAQAEFSHSVTLESKQKLKPLLDEAFQGRQIYELVDMDHQTQALILSADSADELAETLRSRLLSIEPSFGLEVTAYIGDSCATLASIGDSYRAAAKLADACAFSILNSKVVTAAHARQNSEAAVYYPIGTEQSILNAIIHGKTAVWQAALDDILRTNQAQRAGNLAHLPLMLTATINRILDGLNPKATDGLPDRTMIYGELRACRSYEELGQRARELLGALAELAQRSHEASTGGIAARMLDYVHQNYAREISLFSLADHMNLSQSYVSSLFKGTTGRNFKDYISEYRYHTACNLLRENPNLRIKEVAERVGCNTGSLSRLFERFAGMTPGAFQSRIREERSAG